MARALQDMTAMMSSMSHRLLSLEQALTQPSSTAAATGSDTCAQQCGHAASTTSDMTAPNTRARQAADALSPDESIAAQVRQHMSQIGLDTSSVESEVEGAVRKAKSKSRKLKSGRVRTTEHFIFNQKVPWPHFGVYKVDDRAPAKYDTLNVQGFVFGYVG